MLAALTVTSLSPATRELHEIQDFDAFRGHLIVRGDDYAT
jgi:hypothetical protein